MQSISKTRRETGTGSAAGRRGTTRTTPDRIVEAIVTAISEHRLAPGTKLGEEHLGEIFGVSRTIIRAVLVRLANNRVVSIEPNRGAFIAQPSVSEARELFDARRVIETALIRRVAHVCTAEQMQALRQHLHEEELARRAGDRRATVKLSGDFHLMLAGIAGSNTLLDLLRELVLRSSLVVMLYDVEGRPTCPADEHERLVETIAAGDAQAAEQLMGEHLEHVEASLSLSEEEPGQVDLRHVFSGFAA